MQGRIFSLVVAGTLLSVLEVKATPVYIDPLGENNSAATLSLDSLLYARGNTAINVYNDQLDTGLTSAWESTGNNVTVTVVSAVAGSAAINVFGVYDLADPSQTIQLFVGGASGNATTFSSPWAQFGFFLINPYYGNTWYSDPSLNNGQVHMVAYQGKGQTLNLGPDPNNPTSTVLLDPSSYLLSWEDTDFSISDFDYNDLTVVVSGATPVPDNIATIGELGLAIFGLVLLQRKYSAKLQHQVAPVRSQA